MFDGYDTKRVAEMTAQERRWFDNVKKAFYDSDRAMAEGAPEECLEAMFKAVDAAKTLRRSLRGEDVSSRNNRKRFIEFLGLEIPAAISNGTGFELRDVRSGELATPNLGEILYDIRCMIHENENLNVSEEVDHHILLDWSRPSARVLGWVVDERLVCNGPVLWNRIREVMAKFITAIDSMIGLAGGASSFAVSIAPKLGSIMPEKRKQKE